MNKRMPKLLCISLLCLSLIILPTSTAWGFGKGAQGADVYAVQGMLSALGYFKAGSTGYFGLKTEAAVASFQTQHGLSANGQVDNQTLQSILGAYGNLRIMLKSSSIPVPTSAPAPMPTLNPSPALKFAPTLPSIMSTPAPTGYPLTGLTSTEQQLIDLVNQARTAAGLHSLVADAALTHTARLKSQDMINLNYFAHQSPTYGSPFDMMSQFGITFQAAGENIACNQTVAAAHQALMNSQGHRENIMNPSFGYLGIGIVSGGPCGQMYTEQFVGR